MSLFFKKKYNEMTLLEYLLIPYIQYDGWILLIRYMLMVFLVVSFVLKVPNMMESSEIEIVTSALPVRTGYQNLYVTLTIFSR